MDGWTNGYGKLKIVPTPMGNIIRTLIESGATLGVSSRGSGEVGPDEVSNFEIVTVDIVAQPSAPEAYPKAIYEGLMNMRGGYQTWNWHRMYNKTRSLKSTCQNKSLSSFVNLNYNRRSNNGNRNPC